MYTAGTTPYHNNVGRILIICVCLIVFMGCAPQVKMPDVQTPDSSGSQYADIVDALISLPAVPEDFEVNPISGRLYVVYREHPYLSVIDEDTLEIIASITIPKSSHHLGINPITNQIYLTNTQKGSVSIIDGATNTLSTTLDVGTRPHSITVNPEIHTLYVSDEKLGIVHVIDEETLTELAQVPVGRSPRGLAVNPATGLVYVANWQDDSVSIIDGETNQRLITLPVGSRPNAVAVDSDLNKVFIANMHGNNVYVVDGRDEQAIIGVIPVETDPAGITVDVEHGWLFVTNSSSHSTSVAQTHSQEVIKTFPTQKFPVDVVIHSKRNVLYIIHRDQPTISVIQIVAE